MLALIKLEQILKRTGFSRSTLYNLIRAGQWPQPIKVTERSNRWLSTEVDAMIALMASDPTADAIRAQVRALEAARAGILVPA